MSTTTEERLAYQDQRELDTGRTYSFSADESFSISRSKSGSFDRDVFALESWLVLGNRFDERGEVAFDLSAFAEGGTQVWRPDLETFQEHTTRQIKFLEALIEALTEAKLVYAEKAARVVERFQARAVEGEQE